MSEKSSINNKNNKAKEKATSTKETKEKTKENKEDINPLSLLSKDLLDEINSLEKIDFEDIRENNIENIPLDETQKESEVNEEEDDYILEIEKDMDKDIFSFEIFKNEDNEKSNESKNIKKDRKSQPIPNSQNNYNFNQIDNFGFPLGRLSYDYPQTQNINNSFNIQFNNNPLQNNINVFNNCFTMNGKSGWVCAFCKNFNYESKYI